MHYKVKRQHHFVLQSFQPVLEKKQYKVLASTTTKYYARATLLFPVGFSSIALCYKQSITPELQCSTPVLLCTAKYYCSLQSATPELQRTRTTAVLQQYCASAEKHYNELIQYYSHNSTTTKYYSTTTVYYSCTTKKYASSTLHYASSMPPLLCTTKNFASTTKYYARTTKNYTGTPLYYNVQRQNYFVYKELLCTAKYYSRTTPVLRQHYSSTTLGQKISRPNTTPVLHWFERKVPEVLPPIERRSEDNSRITRG